MSFTSLFSRIAPSAGLLLLISLPANAESGIAVDMNQAKIVKLARAADTIVIGNPLIADASVQDAKTIVLTGKGFGVTNLVVFDANGASILEDQVVVSRDTAKSVRVYRRANVQTLSCTPFCESATKNEAERASDVEMGEECRSTAGSKVNPSFHDPSKMQRRRKPGCNGSWL